MTPEILAIIMFITTLALLLFGFPSILLSKTTIVSAPITSCFGNFIDIFFAFSFDKYSAIRIGGRSNGIDSSIPLISIEKLIPICLSKSLLRGDFEAKITLLNGNMKTIDI